MLEKLKEIAERYEYLTGLLGSQDIFSDQKKYREITKEHSDITPIVQTYHKYLKVIEELKEAEKLIQET